MIGPLIRPFALAWALIGLISAQAARAQATSTGPGPPYVLAAKSAKRVKVHLTLDVKVPRVRADDWSIFVPIAPELPGQVDARTVLFPQGKAVRDLGEEARPLLFAWIPSDGERRVRDISVRVDWEATLLERRLEHREPDAPAPPVVGSLDARTRKILLASAHQFDHQAPGFRAWLDEHQLRREPKEDEVEFARRAFLAVRRGIKHYEGANIPHMASAVCSAGKADYAGITAVYASALRANGIPTRVLAGRMVVNQGKPANGAWTHAKVEFFANGLGWVPADVAGAIRSGRATDGLESFGVDTAEFLTIHLGTDLVLDTVFGPQTIDWLPAPSWWVKGSGSLDGNQTKVDINVEVEPLDLAEVLARKPARPGSRKPAAKPGKSAR